jgi:hypothetical protein
MSPLRRSRSNLLSHQPAAQPPRRARPPHEAVCMCHPYAYGRMNVPSIRRNRLSRGELLDGSGWLDGDDLWTDGVGRVRGGRWAAGVAGRAGGLGGRDCGARVIAGRLGQTGPPGRCAGPTRCTPSQPDECAVEMAIGIWMCHPRSPMRPRPRRRDPPGCPARPPPPGRSACARSAASRPAASRSAAPPTAPTGRGRGCPSAGCARRQQQRPRRRRRMPRAGHRVPCRCMHGWPGAASSNCYR